MGRLDGKVAVITGGASGIGAATAELFIAEGASVVIGDMQAEVGEETAGRLGERCAFVPCDVTKEEQVAALVDEAVKRFGRLDVIFNNAGFGGAMGPVESISSEDYDITMDVLLKGVFYGMKHAAPVMKAQGSGSIISTASICGLTAGVGAHLYTAAKAAVISLTESVANELAEQAVRVNCICPGFIATPLFAGKPLGSAGQEAAQATLDKIRPKQENAQPMHRMGEPLDIAKAALFLASDDSEWITGHAMVVDGGFMTGKPWRKQASWLTEPHPIRLYRPEGR
ncbi:MAG: glucose 1-dehydrogenase [Acidimicrobiales bacterium]|nr:glucose 1-dehydrogenase [Acidimicrobiales bacterium]